MTGPVTAGDFYRAADTATQQLLLIIAYSRLNTGRHNLRGDALPMRRARVPAEIPAQRHTEPAVRAADAQRRFGAANRREARP